MSFVRILEKIARTRASYIYIYILPIYACYVYAETYRSYFLIIYPIEHAHRFHALMCFVVICHWAITLIVPYMTWHALGQWYDCSSNTEVVPNHGQLYFKESNKTIDIESHSKPHESPSLRRQPLWCQATTWKHSLLPNIANRTTVNSIIQRGYLVRYQRCLLLVTRAHFVFYHSYSTNAMFNPRIFSMVQLTINHHSHG